MSEYIKPFLLSKKNKKLIPKIKQKPAEKNINYDIVDSISYNLIENMTMFKNSEINKSELNLRLLGNISILLSKGKIDQKKIKKNKNKTKNDFKKCSIENFGIYFPVNRIMCLEENNSKRINNKKNKRNNNFKIPFSYEHFNAFIPFGKNLFERKNNVRLLIKNDGRVIKDISLDKGKTSKNSSYYQGSNENDNSNSIISEESNNDLSTYSNKGLSDSSNKIVFKNLKKFKKYKELDDYIECPLINNNSSKEKYNNFIKLLDNIDDIIEYNEYNNNNLKENIYLNEEIDINDYNFKKIYIDNNDIINNLNFTNNEQNRNKNELVLNICEDKKSKSQKILKYNNNNDLIFLNNSLKNDLSETMDKTSSSMNQSQIINNKSDKSQQISSSLRKKYIKKMNENYIKLMHDIYMNFISNCLIAKPKFLDDIMMKKFFVQLFKKFLLFIGIVNRKIYERILKNQIFNSKILSFVQFIQSFDIILNEYDNNNQNIMAKFLFLLNILPRQNNDDFLDNKNLELFFELLGCNLVYIQDFCENLGERLVIRYNAIYRNEEFDNIIVEKYRFTKMRIILESFFDEFQVDD